MIGIHSVCITGSHTHIAALRSPVSKYCASMVMYGMRKVNLYRTVNQCCINILVIGS